MIIPLNVASHQEVASYEEKESLSDKLLNKGMFLFCKQCYADAVKNLTRAAELGNIEAQLYLGYFYFCGRGVKRHYKKSAEWYEKAANQGDPSAQFFLGNCYYYGVGVRKNYKKAAKLFLSCAEADSDSCFMAGECYEYGSGVTKNLCKAIEYYTVAVKHGHEEAKEALTRLAS